MQALVCLLVACVSWCWIRGQIICFLEKTPGGILAQCKPGENPKNKKKLEIHKTLSRLAYSPARERCGRLVCRLGELRVRVK